MGDLPDAAAPTVTSDEAEAELRARAAAALAGPGSASAAPAVGAAFSSDDLALWAGQVEGEFARANAHCDERWVEIFSTVFFAHDEATVCADQVANFEVVFC